VRRAKAAGLPVSCETAPHYLVLCDEDLREEGRFKMNPPLRSRADREAEMIPRPTSAVLSTAKAHSNPTTPMALPASPPAGEPADLTAVDTERAGTVDPDRFLSMGRSTPFAGMAVRGEVMLTLVGGREAYRNGDLKR